MLEQQRLDYLQAMGVVQWMPRQPLPHAPQPRWLPAAVVPVAAHSKPSFAHPGGHIAHPAAGQLLHDSTAAVRPVLSRLLQEDATAAAEPAAGTPVAENQVVENVDDGRPPQFQLAFYRSGLPLIWACDSLAGHELMPQLIHSVQKALTGHASFVPEPVGFRWPFIVSPHEDQSTPVALQALRAQWQFLHEQGGEVLLTFGRDSQYWLGKIGVNSHFHADTVAALLQDADAKRRLWLTLLPLLKVPG